MRYPTLAITFLAAAAVAAPPPADDEFRYGRIRYLEPGVTLQRGSEAGAEEATNNLPFLPGDRVWTDGSGRVEFQFADGTLLRVDSRSKVDYVAHDEGRGNDRVVLRIWSGGLYLHTHDRRRFADFDIDTPGGLVEVRDRGVFRVDVASGETRLSVYDGEAALSADRRITVQAGERAYARRDGGAESPGRFDTREGDEFARWDGAREGNEARAVASERYLPEDVGPYASELDSHGSWYFEAEVGNVWRPYVVAGWRPYQEGRWAWTSYGWTWVPNEPWGWATSHYGRWGSGALGWYWIPGRTWSPAWVSWAIGADTVGWAPLGRHDRPVNIQDRGHAVPRGSVVGTSLSPWIYAHRTDLGARDLARRRIDSGTVDVQSLRLLDSPHARLGHDLHVAEGAPPKPRNVMTKPTMGDTVPEMRVNPETTIPSPWLRYLGNERAKERAKDREGREARTVGVETRAPERISAPAGDHARPTDARSPRREPAAADVRERPREQGDSDRDVLRRVFQPLSERRSRDGDSGESSRRTRERDGDSSRARPEPAGVAPRSEPRTPPRAEPQRTPPPEHRDHAVERRPVKDKDR